MQEISSARNNPPTHRLTYLRVTTLITGTAVLCCTIFLLARLVILNNYVQIDGPLMRDDLWHALFTGLRFDIAIVIRACVLGLLLSLGCLWLPTTFTQPARWVWAINHYNGYWLVLLAVTLSITNIAYISFFNRPMDSFVFQGMHYGASAAWQSVYDLDNFYLTVLIMVLALAGGFFFYARLSRWIVTHIHQMPLTSRGFISVLVVSLTLFVLLGRGTVSTFPLSYRHLIVSPHASINNLVPNGIVALYYGHRDFSKSKNFQPAEDARGRALFTAFYGRQPNAGSLFEQFFTTTDRSLFLQQNPPHLVLNLVESMGQALLTDKFSTGINFAGSLDQHLEQDIYFQQFLPGHNDTQKALISLLLNTEYSDISRSSYQHIPLATSAARVFKRAGYRTVFVYAGFEGLMNRGAYFKTQGFDEFIGAHKLRSLFADMASSVWGGEDKYVFEYCWQRLSEHRDTDKPLFVVNLTVTNHPPYELPAHHANQPVEADADLTARLRSLPLASLDTYVYTNDQLGQFVSRVKNSALSQSTIVAATGDHAIRGMHFDHSEQLHQLSVPFYLYIPSQYAPEATPDTEQIGSHKDIMPTLFNLALSEARYPNLGRDLLAPTAVDAALDFAYHANYTVVDRVAYNNDAHTALSGQKIAADFTLTKQIVSGTTVELQPARYYKDILDWLTRYQLVNH